MKKVPVLCCILLFPLLKTFLCRKTLVAALLLTGNKVLTLETPCRNTETLLQDWFVTMETITQTKRISVNRKIINIRVHMCSGLVQMCCSCTSVSDRVALNKNKFTKRSRLVLYPFPACVCGLQSVMLFQGVVCLPLGVVLLCLCEHGSHTRVYSCVQLTSEVESRSSELRRFRPRVTR